MPCTGYKLKCLPPDLSSHQEFICPSSSSTLIMKISILPIINSVSLSAPPFIYMLNETEGYFYQEYVPDFEQRGMPGSCIVKVNVTEFTLQSDMFLNIRPNFLVK
ncbi:hypothetical protein ABVT39_006418 [Epinephelus coioides]